MVKSYLSKLLNCVPYRFLFPWINISDNKEMELRSCSFENECLYAIHGDEIEINPKWESYLIDNYTILRDFSFWNLTLFLQKRNPNVPDIPSKLIKPIQRESLDKQRKLWDLYIDMNGPINCIYTGVPLYKKHYDLDHFIPWSFVSHNLIWNLLPANSSINSSKSNNLPSLDLYLKPFAKIQHDALRVVYSKKPNDKTLEDYLMLYDSIPELICLSESEFLDVYRKIFSPMAQIAENMGFMYWNNKITI